MKIRIIAAMIACCVSQGILAEAPEPGSGTKDLIHQVVEGNDVLGMDGITSTGQPSEVALQEYADRGYAAVIDLRTRHEDRGMDEENVVENLGMDYLALPIAGAAAVTFDNARKLDRLLELYDDPVLIHCASGNRVGALLALRARLDGASIGAAVEIGKAAGLTRLEKTVRTVLIEQ